LRPEAEIHTKARPGVGGREDTMIEARLVKVVMVFCLALFALVVTYDNLVDYGSNYLFVQHVLSMDTIFPGNALTWRAITAPAMRTRAPSGRSRSSHAARMPCALICARR